MLIGVVAGVSPASDGTVPVPGAWNFARGSRFSILAARRLTLQFNASIAGLIGITIKRMNSGVEVDEWAVV